MYSIEYKLEAYREQTHWRPVLYSTFVASLIGRVGNLKQDNTDLVRLTIYFIFLIKQKKLMELIYN